MILKTVRDQLAADTAIQDENRLLYILNLAGIEVWQRADFPGTNIEETFEVATEYRISLPWRVQHVRAVKSCDKLPVELNTAAPYYFASKWYQTPWEWRVLQITPLARDIDNATTLTFSIPKAQAADVIIYLTGKTDTASRRSEQLTLPAGATTVSSLGGYEEVYDIAKSSITDDDVSILSASGDILGVIPNHLLGARNTYIQVYDPCYMFFPCCITRCKCLNILYKPLFCGWNSIYEPLPTEGMYLPLLYKAREVAKLNPEVDITIFIQKFINSYRDVAADYARGKSLKLATARNPFTRTYTGYL